MFDFYCHIYFHMQAQNVYTNLIKRVQNKVNGSQEQPNLKLKPLSSFANNVLKVEVKEGDHEEISGKTFLIKIFREYLSQFSNKNVENEVVATLSNLNQYSHVYYYSKDYRVQEFIIGYAPSNDTVTENQMVEIIRKTADLVRIFKNYSGTKPEAYRNQRKISHMFPIFKQVVKQCEKLFPESYQICKVYTEAILKPIIRETLEKIVPDVMVPTHNDCHFHNVLIRGKDQKLFLIDFEFFSLNYRGFELGNFFNEYATDYVTFEIKQDLELPQKTKDLLVAAYYKQVEPNMSLQAAKREVEVGRMISHLFWLFIGVKQVKDPKITIDMQYYIKRRYEEFMKYYNMFTQNGQK